MTLSPLIAGYDHILLDLDGCVWVGDEPTPGAVAAITALRAAGKGVAFVTNDSQLLTEEYVRKLWRLGFQASVEEVVTVGGALQFVLAERFAGRAAVVIGSGA
ncbi:MAG TPA: HAD family hydrolase, partial [Solirubrobacteraceae bacterium]|nr:HAD family hydrolase [Solirubrobacteraceae bacterium]